MRVFATVENDHIFWIGIRKDRPVVIVSRNEDCVKEEAAWPEAVKKFVPKAHGPQAILDAALTLSGPYRSDPTTEER